MAKLKYIPEKTPTENLYMALYEELPKYDLEAEDLPELIDVLDTILKTLLDRPSKCCSFVQFAYRSIGRDIRDEVFYIAV